jgi:rubrerythrin
MTKYRCGYCKFRFQISRIPKKCPYCGKESGIMVEETADELIKDVDKMV